MVSGSLKSWTNNEKSVLFTFLYFSGVSVCVHLFTVAGTWLVLRGMEVIIQLHQESVCCFCSRQFVAICFHRVWGVLERN